ncbi:MAG: hypothetical protein AAGC46_05650 [Solirubrobacteraceae bacterium]|nr:hypothetical protein [Patulibacter sp.]
MSNERMTGGPRPTMLRLVNPPPPQPTPGPALYPAFDEIPQDFTALLDGLEAVDPVAVAPLPPDPVADAGGPAEIGGQPRDRYAPGPRAEVPTLPDDPVVPTAPDSPSIPDPSVPEPVEPATPAVPAEPVVPIDPVPQPEAPDPEPAEVPAR